METYKVTKIDNETGDITVTFSIDGKEQIISGLPVDKTPVENFKKAISEYFVAYKQGIQVFKKPQIQIDPAIQALLNKDQPLDG